MDITRGTAEAVRALLEERQMSELALAEATLIPRTTLKRSLDGSRAFKLDELGSIATALDTTPEQIIVRARRAA